MSNEIVFFVVGIALAISAVVFSFAGLKFKDFPGKAAPLVVLWFAVFVVGSTTFAVLHAKDEDKARAAELREANEKAEEDAEEDEIAPEGTEGAQGGNSEEAEEEIEGGEGFDEEAGPESEEESELEGAPGPEEGGEVSPESGAQSEESAEGEPTEGGEPLALKADETELAFDTTELETEAGEVTIDLDNPSSVPHNVAIEKDGEVLAESETLSEGESSASAELEPGTYTFLCTVPGHAEAGMEGTLTVK